ncbi:amidase [Caulobacter sp. 73W]|uniref:Amidase n=1 Tax=Caulobacter sp. 73W TaxID=3161137 RepID=A0AB39KU86_9CAUL
MKTILAAALAMAAVTTAHAETSAERTAAYLKKIAAEDRAEAPGKPPLNSVIAVSPVALDQARARDAERKAGKVRGPIHGWAILLKDNIDSSELPTTAGSLALKDNMTGRDAPLVANLRQAGAVILGKTNLSEWANFRSTSSLSGWSAVGGLTRNAHDRLRNACGSSAGSGTAVAAGFADAAVGTETNGSVICPAAVNGIVGFKPTVGLVSRTHVVPISASQDTAGPMTRTVSDAAALLTAMAGSDPADPATAQADARKTEFLAALNKDALKGTRIGVARYAAGFHPETDAVFEKALATLKAQGAILVDIKSFPRRSEISPLENRILCVEFKAGLAAYLASTDPTKVKPRNLTDLIAFNKAHAAQEMPLFAQELFEICDRAKTPDDADYLKAKADAHRIAGPEGIDVLLKQNDVVAIVAPTMAPAYLIDPVLRGGYVGGGIGGPAAVAGYPHLTVPMGKVKDLPVGLSILGTAWDDARVLSLGYAFEQGR